MTAERNTISPRPTSTSCWPSCAPARSPRPANGCWSMPPRCSARCRRWSAASAARCSNAAAAATPPPTSRARSPSRPSRWKRRWRWPARPCSAVPAQVSGTVRITTTDTILHGLAAPALKDLVAEHPLLNLELHTANEVVSLTRREADIAVRATMRPPQHLRGPAPRPHPPRASTPRRRRRCGAPRHAIRPPCRGSPPTTCCRTTRPCCGAASTSEGGAGVAGQQRAGGDGADLAGPRHRRAASVPRGRPSGPGGAGRTGRRTSATTCGC